MAKELRFFKRYFEGKYSRTDYNSVLKGFQTKGDSNEFASNLQDHWKEYKEPQSFDVNLDPILLKLHRQIIGDKKDRQPIKLWGMLQRVAAILFIPLLLASIVFNFKNEFIVEQETSWAEIKCPLGVRTEFELPDGSTGFLNSGSTLKFPTSFKMNERSVQLLGEAYFDVVHNKNQPFHVQTGKLDVKVLGTTFNVVAYPEQQFEEITLESGKVDILSKSGQSITVLLPDEQLNLDLQTNKYQKSKVVASQYISWTTGVLSFRNERFEQVVRRLGRWYNIDIVLEGTELNNYTYHATFENEPFEEVLKLMELTAPISYQMEARKLLPDGSFSKRKVHLKFDQEKMKEFN